MYVSFAYHHPSTGLLRCTYYPFMLLVQRLKQSIEKSSFAVFEINFDFVHLLNVNFSLYDKGICLYNDLKCQEK